MYTSAFLNTAVKTDGYIAVGEVKKVLLIEDDEYDRYFFVRALGKIENVIIHDIATNGQEALEKLETCSTLPDIIFTDINMPVMDGIKCLEAITGNPQTKHIPVVVISSDVTKLEQVRELGAKAFIKKPIDCMMLQKQLEQVIGLNFITDLHIANQTFQTALYAR